MRAINNFKTNSELVKLAMCFHMDFEYELDDHNPSEYTDSYFEGLNESEKLGLKKEMETVLEKYPGKDQKGLINEWFRLGAGWWDRKNFDLRSHITEWIKQL